MIYIENLDFGYQKKREVFSGLNLSLTGGHIYGLLGKNGAGKTTLLKLIGGLLFPLRGRIEVCDAIPRLRKPSFLSDIFFIPEEICLPDMKMIDYIRSSFKDILDIEKNLNTLEDEMSTHYDEKIVSKYNDLLSRYEYMGGYKYKKEIEVILSKYDFSDEDKDKHLNEITGGQLTKIS